MKAEDFKVVQNYYTTNSLIYILYDNKVVGFVETFKNNYFEEIEPNVWKSRKKKRTLIEISNDCENVIKKLIK